MKGILKHIVLFGLLLLIFSCKKETVPEAFVKLENTGGGALGDTLQVDENGGLLKINVKSNGFWKVTRSESDNWMNIFPDFGKKNGTLNVSLDSNNSGSIRKGELMFLVEGKTITTLTLIQKKVIDKDEKIQGPFNPVLDIAFNADGSAEDISEQKHDVVTEKGPTRTTRYSDAFQRYVGRYNHTPGGSSFSTGFDRIDFSKDWELQQALSNGHSIESIFMLDVDHPLPDAEMKMFCAHQSGGTGLMIGDASKNHAIIFLPHIGGHYIWTNSGVTPEKGKFYDVVGVWNKEEGKTYIYVNGELKDTQNATGNFDLPSAGSQWFAVGGDPTGEMGQGGWKGDVVVARLYDQPLNADQVKDLWNEVKNETPLPTSDEVSLSDALVLSRKIKIKNNYTIESEGFKQGDKIRIKPVSGNGTEYLLEGTVDENSYIFKIPEDFTTGSYRFYVVRGNQEIDIGIATLTVVEDLPQIPQVVAHRGWWKKKGAAQNSIASLAGAQELGVYGSETDTWITTDGKLVIHHDATINGVTIEQATYSQIKDMTLSNGETLPTLQEYLTQVKQSSSTKLILEIKEHKHSQGGVDNNDRAAIAVDQLVRSNSLLGKVNFISFSMEACKKLIELEPNAKVAYLTGSSPQYLDNLGFTGIDFKITEYKQHPEWIEQAHDLGMKVNVWTVDDKSDMLDMINQGVDYITTNFPEVLQQLLNNYK